MNTVIMCYIPFLKVKLQSCNEVVVFHWSPSSEHLSAVKEWNFSNTNTNHSDRGICDALEQTATDVFSLDIPAGIPCRIPGWR